MRGEPGCWKQVEGVSDFEKIVFFLKIFLIIETTFVTLQIRSLCVRMNNSIE